MPTLYAVFIAIDRYPDPRHVLRGCVADMEQFYGYLNTCCTQMGLAFRPLKLSDQQATRKEVINAFEHFRQSEEGDACVFFYAGHGARHDAPEMFRMLESDKKIESMVCWDSRRPGGHDLMDKELSYLIWDVMQGKDMPMVTITDCCHSGRMRNMPDAEQVRIREVRDLGGDLPAEQYLGYKHYRKDGQGQVSPPQGRRIHLGAARDVETAKEISVDGVSRGIFTSCLVQALANTGPLVSYSELMHRVQTRVRANIADQSPQLEATFAADKNLHFLSETTDTGAKRFLATHDPKLGWIINAGAMHGIHTGDAENSTILELIADRTRIVVKETLPGFSRVEGMNGHDTKQVYAAVLIRRAIPQMTIVPAPGSNVAAMAALQREITAHTSVPFRLGAEGDPADFEIRTGGNAFSLTRPSHENPVFPPVGGHDAGAAKAFLACLQIVAHWQQVLQLSNPGTAIADEEILLSLYRVTDPGNYENDTSVEDVDWQHSADFPYLPKNGAWYQPAFQLKIRNKGRRPLWIGLLYLGVDFSIQNQLLPKQRLAPGEEAWAQDVFENNMFRTIPLVLDKELRRQGRTTIEEYLKLIICTEELNTDGLTQNGLDMIAGSTQATRSMQLRSWIQPEQRDWSAQRIAINIIYDAARGQE